MKSASLLSGSRLLLTGLALAAAAASAQTTAPTTSVGSTSAVQTVTLTLTERPGSRSAHDRPRPCSLSLAPVFRYTDRSAEGPGKSLSACGFPDRAIKPIPDEKIKCPS